MSIKPFSCPRLLSLCLTLWPAVLFAGQDYRLSSPDGSIELRVITDGQLRYELHVDGETLIAPSAIGMRFADGRQFGAADPVLKATESQGDEVVHPPVPVRSAAITDRYKQLSLDFKSGYSLQLRAYDQGVAYRFVGHLRDQAVLNAETVDFNFVAGSYAYFPFEPGFHSATQPLFTPLPAKSIDGDELGSLPALFVAKGINLLLTETDLQSYPGLWLRGRGNGGVYGVHPYDLDDQGQDTTQLAKLSRNRSFPWRIIGVARSDAALLDNQLSYLLAEPSRIKDTGWLKPGKIAWDWYNENNLKGVPFKAGINADTYNYYIDFAARFGIESILLDDGWSSHEDVLSVLPGVDLPAILHHAKAKGVDVQLWVPWSGLDKDMEKAMQMYASWGISGLKIDFMNSDSQRMVDFYWRAAAMAAKYRLMVNFHGAYKPAGIHRTYPNVLTREGVKGLENHKWADTITPTHNLHLPFIRMIAGPMDYTPGAMANAHKKDFAKIFSRPMSLGTRAHQVAMYVVYESPLQMLADAPSAYLAEPEVPAFIAGIPTVWDDYKVLHASIGDYLVIARRKGDDWYIGAMSNEQPRTLPITLDFLAEGEYRMQVFKDGANADRHAEDYVLETRNVKRGEPLTIELAGGGGWVATLKKP